MAPGPAMELLGRVAFEASQMRPLLPTYLHLLVSAIFPIYTAAHASLARPSSAAKPEKKKTRSGDDDLSEDDEDSLQVVQKIEGLTAWDALTFPLLAGATLTSLYFLIKWLEDPTILNKVLSVYFSQMGMFFGAKFLKDIFSTFRSLLLPTQYSLEDTVWRVDVAKSCFTSTGPAGSRLHSSPFPGRLRAVPLHSKFSTAVWRFRKAVYAKARLRLDVHNIVKIRSPIDVLDVVSFLIVGVIVAWQTFVSTPWFLTNFMGFAFCYGSLQMVTPTSGWVGTLVLSALFFYDIYFVFFTPLMVTVATKLDVPIKLLFPRPSGCVMPAGVPEGSEAMQEYLECLAKKRTMAMLGLGDIVVPGMMLAFALRFDLYLFYLRRKSNTKGERTKTNSSPERKQKYTPATGSWGERFWTTSSLQDAALQAKSFPKPYFHASVIGYLAGMIITMIVMQVAQHAQPALLYLVPGVLISLWGTALIRGDLKLLWAYTEDLDDEDKDKEPKKVVERDEKEANGENRIDGVEKATTTDSKSVVTSRKVDEKTEAESKKTTEALHTSLIIFTITLPASKTSSNTGACVKADGDATISPKANITSNSSNTDSRDIENSTDILPDIRADHQVLEKLSREVTRDKQEAAVTTSKDGQEPPGKRRRKA